MKTLSQEEFSKMYGSVALKQLDKTPAKEANNKPGLVDRIKQDVKDSGLKVNDALTGQGANQGQSDIRRGFEATATAFNTIPKVASELLPEFARNRLDKIGEEVGKGVNAITSKIGDSPALQKWIQDHPEASKNLEEVLGTTSSAGEIAGDVLLADQVAGNASKVTKETSTLAKSVADSLSSKVPNLNSIPNFTNKVGELLSSDIDEKTATILKETPKESLDKYIKYAQEAASDPRKLTPFDYVGDSMEKATKALREEMKKVGEAKSEFIKPLRKGFDTFNGKSLVNDLTSLHNRLSSAEQPFVRSLIKKAKEIKTVYDADRFIDDAQEALKTSGAQNIIPRGSALQRQVSGVIGKFNGVLKDTLPPEYSKLNARYSNLKNVTDSLNKALGEVIDGQSTRGGSLVKQFFSPSGKKAKVIFDYVKKNTGIDLAQETTLARFAMDLFDDPRGRSLLEGIPKSTSGLIDKTIDFAVEKAGIGKKLQQTVREGEISKARKLTK